MIYNFEEIESRQDFLSVLVVNNKDELQEKLSGIVGQYKFKDYVKCGISICRQSHKEGFLANLKDNQEILVGNKCGKNYFGVEFNDFAKTIGIQITEAEQYKRLENTFQQLDSMRNEYQEILNNHVLNYEKITDFIKVLNGSNGFLNYLFITRMKQKVENGKIFKEIAKTDEEMALEREMLSTNDQNKQVYVERYKKELIGYIENYEVIWELQKADKLIKYFDEIHEKLKHPKDMKKKDRSKIAKDLNKYKNNIYELNDFCKRANKLLRKDNIKQLEKIFSSNDSHQLEIIKRIIKPLPN
jgi:hypothetical protein